MCYSVHQWFKDSYSAKPFRDIDGEPLYREFSVVTVVDTTTRLTRLTAQVPPLYLFLRDDIANSTTLSLRSNYWRFCASTILNL
jgi:hypothetical protein